MKKLIASLLMVGLITGLTIGCGGGTKKTEEKKTEEKKTEEKKTEEKKT